MAGQLSTSPVPSPPHSPYQTPATPPTSPADTTASKRTPLPQPHPACDSASSPTPAHIASLITYKPAEIRYGNLGGNDLTLLYGTLFLVTGDEYQNYLNLRFFDSPIGTLPSDNPATYSETRTPWALLHPKYGRSWVHEGWLIYDFANVAATVGKDFVAVTFERESYERTQPFCPIGAYTLDGNFKPNHDHASNTIVGLPIFCNPSSVNPAKAFLDNTLALPHYHKLATRERRIGSHTLPVVQEYSPRPISAQTMRYIELIAKHLDYPANSSNATLPKRTWLKTEPLLAPIIDFVTGTLKNRGQLYGLRGNHAIFRGRVWDRLCSMGDRDRDRLEMPSYWQNVYVENRFGLTDDITEEDVASISGDGESVVKRDSWTSASHEDNAFHLKTETADTNMLGAQ